MEYKTVKAEARTERKKGPTGRLRRTGRIPAVVYGQDQNLTISVDAHEFGNTFKQISESTIITLETPGGNVDVLVKECDEDLLTGTIRHIDFYEVATGKLLRTHIQVHCKGQAKGVREGGILDISLHELEVECLPRDIPEEFAVEITELETGHAIHVSDIQAPEGVRILNQPEQVVVSVVHARVEALEPEAEEELVAEGEERAAAAAETEEGEEE
ncbi:MAG: 50S ribosomal protein L25 [Spirochaetaceae bacterium]|nr:MAG: 50S ribosomal protein L25 [Spirochaetaceae bacterium]